MDFFCLSWLCAACEEGGGINGASLENAHLTSITSSSCHFLSFLQNSLNSFTLTRHHPSSIFLYFSPPSIFHSHLLPFSSLCFQWPPLPSLGLFSNNLFFIFRSLIDIQWLDATMSTRSEWIIKIMFPWFKAPGSGTNNSDKWSHTVRDEHYDCDHCNHWSDHKWWRWQLMKIVDHCGRITDRSSEITYNRSHITDGGNEDAIDENTVGGMITYHRS